MISKLQMKFCLDVFFSKWKYDEKGIFFLNVFCAHFNMAGKTQFDLRLFDKNPSFGVD